MNAPQPGAPRAAGPDRGMVHLGRSGEPPLRILGRLAAEARIEAEADGVALIARAALWDCAPEGWAVSLRLGPEEAAHALAFRCKGPAEAARRAARTAEAALRLDATRGPASLAAAPDIAQRRYLRARLARQVSEALAAELEARLDGAG